MSQSKSLTLGGLSLPLDTQAILSGDDAPTLAMGDGIIKFDFGFRQVRFVGQLDMARGKARLRLVGDLGPMPFSAESTAARAGLARIVEAANTHLGAGTFRVTLGRVLLGGDFAIPVPVDATGLVTGSTRFLVPALPYMELIALYVRPPLAPARVGESAVRPEWRKKSPSGWGR
jgi:hypothetical protein